MSINTIVLKTVRPDAKGRITLGDLAKGVSSFVVTLEDDKIILVPYTEIPAKERWLFANKDALSQVANGLKDSVEKRVRSRGSFKKYINNEID